MHTSVGLPFDYRKSLDKIRRMRNLTFYDFLPDSPLTSKKILCYPQSKRLIDFLTGSMSFISLKLTLTNNFGGICNIIMIESECIHTKLLFTDKKVD